MKIYTKKGDQGKTSLFGGGPLDKDDLRIEVYGAVDELNSVLGLGRSFLENNELQHQLQELQENLFILGSELACPQANPSMQSNFLKEEHVRALEKWIDDFQSHLSPLQNFILPGGHSAASCMHMARTVCRRVERRLVSLNKVEALRSVLLVFVNRLSDYFFVLAREINHLHKIEDIEWLGLKKNERHS